MNLVSVISIITSHPLVYLFKQKEIMLVQFNMTPEQLLVITSLLNYVRLGQETMFGNAVTDLAINLGNHEQFTEMLEKEFNTPDITFEFSEEEGMVINVL